MMPKHPKSIDWGGVALAFLAAGTICSCAKPTAQVGAKSAKPQAEISVQPPVVKVETISNVIAKKMNVAAGDHETARTDCAFSIIPELGFSIVDEKNDKDDRENGYHVWVEITSCRLNLALPVTSYISADAPKYVREHENGHVKICCRIYADARSTATEAAKKAFEKRFEGIGKDRKLALSNALQFAGEEIGAYYRAKMAGEAEKVSSKYDQLCKSEDRREKVDETIEDAFASVQAENSTLQK
jgi:hypothetical protein